MQVGHNSLKYSKRLQVLLVVDNENRTAFYLACMECNLDVVRFLIKRRANPIIARMIDEEHSETPLGCAIRWGYTTLVSM